MRRRRVPALVASVTTLMGAFLVPATLSPAAADPPAGRAGHAHQPVPLPAHSQRPVCGPPAAGAARCHAHVVTHPDSARPLATTSFQSGWRPADLQAAYQLPTGGAAGSGPTVAIVDAYDNPNVEADLAAYRAEFGLGACTSDTGCFTKTDQNGGTTYPSGDTGWGSEIDLDVEMVSAACPSCKILLVEADSNGFGDLMTAVRYAAGHASFVSNSYGGSEFRGESTYDDNFTGAGVAFTVSSGDNGYGVEYPAASPNVTAVGGTSLTTDASSTRGWSENAWSGAGSGCSGYEPKPAWQDDSGCGMRTVADVSAVADPNTGVAVYDSYGSSNGANWFVYGGTSVAAPFVAGAWALTGAPSTSTPTAQVPYLNDGWFDVVGGTNTRHCRSGYLCQAVSGYDGPTGLGTPAGTTGFGGGSGGTGGGTGGTNAAPTSSFTAECADLTCDFTDTSSDSDGSVTSWSWSFGDSTAGSTAENPSHTYPSGGEYTVSLTVTDDAGATDTATQVVSVSSAPTGALSVSATGHKVRGRNTVDLTWTGADSVTITRDGALVTDSASGGSYTDQTGDRGGATYTYEVCDNAGSAGCATTSVTF